MDNLKIRKAVADDVDALVQLNFAWYRPNLPDINNGFLSVTYDDSYFKNIIDKDDIVVFTAGDKLIGYALVNTAVKTRHVLSIQEEYFSYRPANIHSKVAFSYQILIDKDFQGTGFFYEAQKEYLKYFATKYDWLVSTINKENARSVNAHKKAGWTFIDTPKHYFIIEHKL